MRQRTSSILPIQAEDTTIFLLMLDSEKRNYRIIRPHAWYLMRTDGKVDSSDVVEEDGEGENEGWGIG